MIKTKSIFDTRDTGDGIRVLVSRYKPWPKKTFIPSYDWWFRNLGPSVKLLSGWKRGLISWEQYQDRYLREVEQPNSLDLIDWLSRQSATHTVTLLCYEPESDSHCHRHILKRLIDLI